MTTTQRIAIEAAIREAFSSLTRAELVELVMEPFAEFRKDDLRQAA